MKFPHCVHTPPPMTTPKFSSTLQKDSVACYESNNKEKNTRRAIMNQQATFEKIIVASILGLTSNMGSSSRGSTCMECSRKPTSWQRRRRTDEERLQQPLPERGERDPIPIDTNGFIWPKAGLLHLFFKKDHSKLNGDSRMVLLKCCVH